MFIRKAHAGSAPGHTWTENGQVIEVEDELAAQLLNIPHGGFSVAEAPDDDPVTENKPEPEADPDVEEKPEPEVHEEPETEIRRPAGRPRLPRDKHGNIIR